MFRREAANLRKSGELDLYWEHPIFEKRSNNINDFTNFKIDVILKHINDLKG
jgi:hypothetical protein